MISNKELAKRLEDFETACRDAGLKVTHQRLEVFRELASALDHPSVETLFKRLKKRMPTLSIDTVYRTLSTMEQHSLATRVQTIESQARYEANLYEHHHAVCEQCGEILDFEWNLFEVADLPEEIQNWGKISRKNATLYGLCNKCSRNKTS